MVPTRTIRHLLSIMTYGSVLIVQALKYLGETGDAIRGGQLMTHSHILMHDVNFVTGSNPINYTMDHDDGTGPRSCILLLVSIIIYVDGTERCWKGCTFSEGPDCGK